MASNPTRSRVPGGRFVRSMLKALVDEATYDLRRNPSLWIGFLLAAPIPVMTFAAEASTLLKLLSLPAPFFWAGILGAAGRVGMLREQEVEELADEVEKAEGAVRQVQADLGAVESERKALEEEHEEVVSELKLAQDVQATMLSPPIQRPDVEVVPFNLPTRFIGGDYLHANVVDDRWLYLVVLDVSGHGISASLVVARLHAMIRRLTLTRRSPSAMLKLLNTAAQQLLEHTYFFITGVVVKLDLTTGKLRYATAGHPAQVLLRKDGRLEKLRTRNRLLGMHDDIFDERRPTRGAQLEPGDSLVLFTDGLFEVLENGKGEILGEPGLHDRLEGLASLEPFGLIGAVMRELTEFQGRSEFDDDVTLLVARYLGPQDEAPDPQS